MKKRLLNAWIDDLNGGKFRQATRSLSKDKTAHEDGRRRDERAGMCCLGVLSVRINRLKAVRDTGWHFDGMAWVKDGDHEWLELPMEVANAIGLDGGAQSRCIELNDRIGATFAKIAKLLPTFIKVE